MTDKPSDRGGPVDGQRSISGRACLPVLIALMVIGTVLLGSFAVTAVAIGATVSEHFNGGSDV
jgi:hypothetical protein